MAITEPPAPMTKDKIVQTPFKEKSDCGGDDSNDKAFDDKRQSNKGVRRADHFHDGNFLAAGVHGKLDGIGNDEQRDDKQNGNDDQGRNI